MKLSTEVVVVGGGSAGIAAAVEAARAGVGVILVEGGRLGGRAIHTTLLPSRCLERAIDAGTKDAWTAARAEAARLAVRWEARLALRLEDAGVELVRARGRFASKNTLALDDGGTLTFERAVLAAGAAPARLPGDGPDGARLLDPDALFSLDAPPSELLVVGGGAAGAEIVDALSRLGQTKLTWVMDELGLLPRFDRELAEALGDVIMERGVKLVHGKDVVSVKVDASRVSLTLEGGRSYEAPAAVVAIGSRPALHELGVDALELRPDVRGWLAIGEDGATTAPHIFAAGDCTGTSPSSAAAEAMGRAAGRAAAGLEPRPAWPTPIVASTHPAIAQIGLTPERVAGKEVALHTLRFDETIFGLLEGIGEKDDAKGLVRLVCDSETGKILGATALGPGAAEIVSAVGLALRFGATDEELADVFAAVPGHLDVLTRAAR